MTKISAKDVTQIGIMSAVLIAGKAALSFLPNVEIVTLLIIVYTLYFGKKVFFSIFIFIILDCNVHICMAFTCNYGSFICKAQRNNFLVDYFSCFWTCFRRDVLIGICFYRRTENGVGMVDSGNTV